MRELTDAARLKAFMRALGAACRAPARIYLVGGATAVLEGWRTSTVDVDMKIAGDEDAVLRAIPRLKEELRINVELASPDGFLPPLPGWEERSRFIGREGTVDFFHYDFCSQALAKASRGHARDLEDVKEMIRRGLVDPRQALDLFGRIESQLYRYPSLDAASLRNRVAKAFGGPP